MAVLQTARMTLTPCRPSDRTDFIDLERDPEVMRFLNGGRAVDPEHADPECDVPHAQGNGTLCVGGTPDNQWRLRRLVLPMAGERTLAELGYRLRSMDKPRPRLGGSVALVDWGFENCGYEKIVATTMAVNHASRRVMEKLGLKHTRTDHPEWPEPIAGSEHGEVRYELARARWQDARPRENGRRYSRPA